MFAVTCTFSAGSFATHSPSMQVSLAAQLSHLSLHDCSVKVNKPNVKIGSNNFFMFYCFFYWHKGQNAL